MIQQVKQVIGQSAYDLCIQTYGSLDLITKFCVDNGITDMGIITPQQEYKYDSDLVETQRIEGYIYATDVPYIVRIFSDEFSIEFA
jgi:hypothetical protein